MDNKESDRTQQGGYGGGETGSFWGGGGTIAVLNPKGKEIVLMQAHDWEQIRQK